MRGKYDADIAKLQAVIQHGVGATQADPALGVAFHQLVGKLPIGADASRFSTRKKLATGQLMLSMIHSGFNALIGGLIALALIWAGAPRNWLLLSLGAAFLVLIYFGGWRPFYRSFVLYRGIRPLVQTNPDVEHELAFVAEGDISRQFAKARLKSRVFGLLLMVLSGGFGYFVYADLPNEIPVLSVVMPFVFLMGLGILISGMNKPEMLYRKGYAQAHWADLSTEMKLCLIIGLLASILTFAWLRGWVVF